MSFAKLNVLSIEEIKTKYYSFKYHSHAARFFGIHDTKKFRSWLIEKGIKPIENIKYHNGICKKCGLKKDIKKFEKTKTNYRTTCNSCRWKAKYKPKPKPKPQKHILMNDTWNTWSDYYTIKKHINIKHDENICFHCKVTQKLNEFILQKNVCNSCRREQLRINDKKRLHSSPVHKLRLYTSNAIRRGLKRQNGSKLGKSIMYFLPYTIEELKQHLESQWEPWMNWDNYGSPKKGERKWQIDHIIPQSDLPYDSMKHPNFQKCWALDNLRPLEAFKNMKKHTSILFDINQNS